MFELTTLLIFALLGFYWHNQVTALDTCRKTGRHVTQQKGWVFLDDSLLQKSIRIKPRRGKLALVREFEFEFSGIEAKRHQGAIIHHGGSITEIKYFHEDHIETVNFTRN